jgi:hypothetical protein
MSFWEWQPPSEEELRRERQRKYEKETKALTTKGRAPQALQDFLNEAPSFGKLSASEVEDKLDSVEAATQKFYKGRNFVFRNIMQKYIGWTLLTKEAVALIKSNKNVGPVYDVLAGSGYLAYALNQAGVKTVASDLHVSTKGTFKLKVNYGKVSRKNAAALASRWATKGKPVNVLMSWPPKSVPTAALDLPRGSILFLAMDIQFLADELEHFIDENYVYINKAMLIDTGAKATSSGRIGRNNKLRAYVKMSPSELRVESCVHQLLQGKPVTQIIN